MASLDASQGLISAYSKSPCISTHLQNMYVGPKTRTKTTRAKTSYVRILWGTSAYARKMKMHEGPRAAY